MYSIAYIQVYKKTQVPFRASRNFEDNSRVELVWHEKYTAQEKLPMSWKYLQEIPVVHFCTRE